MNYLDIDFETKSLVDITTVPSARYAEDESSCILILAWCALDVSDDVDSWSVLEDPYILRRKLRRYLREVRQGKRKIRAHNAEFEYWVWNTIGVRDLGLPRFAMDLFYCTRTLCAANGYPASLENACIAMDLDEQKDKRGYELMRMFSIPNNRKKTKKFIEPEEDLDAFYEYIEYCEQDVRSQIAIIRFCQPLSLIQEQTLTLTQRMNERGLPIDIKLCEAAIELKTKVTKNADKEVYRLSKGKVSSAREHKFKDWLNELGYDVPNLQKETLEKLMEHPKTDDFLRQCILLRADASGTSTAKYENALEMMTEDGCVHGFLGANLAITGRWKSYGLQIQNMVKPSKHFPSSWCDFEFLTDLIKQGDTKALECLYSDTGDCLKAAARGMICAPEGFKIINADYSSIEARIVMWMANDKTGLHDFSGQGKIYEAMAALVFNKKVEDIKKGSFERELGKRIILGCGFGMGIDRFVEQCITHGLDVTKALGTVGVKSYRSRYYRVKQAWNDCGKAAINAIRCPGRTYYACNKKLAFKKLKHQLSMKVPSGRTIYYPNPFIKMEPSKFDTDKLEPQVYYYNWKHTRGVGKEWDEQYIWGGIFFQHSVQGTAGDIMARGLLNVEEAGFDCLFPVHDEANSLVSDRYIEKHGKEETIKEFEYLLCKVDPWARGIPLKAEGWIDQRYHK